MPPRTLTAQQLAWLQTRKKALRRARGERTALVREIVDTARVLHATGTGYPELARALGVATELLLAWIDDHTAKPVPRELSDPTGPCVLAFTGDPRPGGNDFITEIAALRRCMGFPFRLVEQVKVEFVELAASLDAHRPVAVHLTAHSVGGCTYLSRNGDPFPVLPDHLAAALLRAAHRPSLLVVNVCGSVAVVPRLENEVTSIVCWPDTATADQCTILAETVFHRLSRSSSISSALDEARLILEADGVTPNMLPRLAGDTKLRILFSTPTNASQH